MSRQFFTEALSWATADGATITATASETIIFPNVSIPANYMQDGRVLELLAFGRFTTVVSNTVTFRIRAGGVGGTVLAASGALVMAATTAGMWRVHAIIQTRTNGSSGTVYCMGSAKINDDVTQTVGSATNAGVEDFMGSAGVATPATASFDLTAASDLALTAQYSSGTTNTMVGHIYLLKSWN
jgi:hypothetical protein